MGLSQTRVTGRMDELAISDWKAFGESVSSWPSLSPRSMVAASCVASCEAADPEALSAATFLTGAAATLAGAFAAGAALLRRTTAFAVAALRDDIDIVSLMQDFVFPQPHLAV